MSKVLALGKYEYCCNSTIKYRAGESLIKPPPIQRQAKMCCIMYSRLISVEQIEGWNVIQEHSSALRPISLVECLIYFSVHSLNWAIPQGTSFISELSALLLSSPMAALKLQLKTDPENLGLKLMPSVKRLFAVLVVKADEVLHIKPCCIQHKYILTDMPVNKLYDILAIVFPF